MQSRSEESTISAVRVVAATFASAEAPCSLCGATGCAWDHLAGWPFCFDCQAGLVLDDSGRLTFSLKRSRCAICRAIGTVDHLTFPLCERELVETDVCGRHLRDLLGRSLSPKAYRRLRGRINRLGFAVEQFYLLHEAFYDEDGNALQPLANG